MDLGSRPLMPFETSIPEGNAPANPRPHQINPVLNKEVDANLDWYLAACLISTLEYLTAFFTTHSSTTRAALTVTPKTDFLFRLPRAVTSRARNKSSRLTPADNRVTYLVQACGLRTRSSPVSGVGLGGLVPRLDSAVLGELYFTFVDFRAFRAHGPRMKNDDTFSAPTGRFVARVSSFVSTSDRRPGRATTVPAADTAFALFLPCF